LAIVEILTYKISNKKRKKIATSSKRGQSEKRKLLKKWNRMGPS